MDRSERENPMTAHLSDEQLINYACHTLTDIERESMDIHLTTCQECRARLTEEESLQRRIRYGIMRRRRQTTPSAQMTFAAIAPQVKRSRRIQMFVKGSNQFLYGMTALLVLALLGVGLIAFFSGVNQTGMDTTILPQATPLAESSYPVGSRQIMDMAAVDLNGDSYVDLAVATGDFVSGEAFVLYNNKDGTFQEPVPVVEGAFTSAIVGDDFDADGDIDLAVTDYNDGKMAVLINKGDGTFEPPVDYEAVGAQWLDIGDLNGDYYPDLVVTHDPDSVGVMFNNGDGTFESGPKYVVGGSGGEGSVHVGELNGDGYPDLVVRPWEDGLVTVLLNNGDGTLGQPVDYEVAVSPWVVTIADLNGDEHPDLAVPGKSGSVSLLYNNGDGTFRDSLIFETGGKPEFIWAGDMDGDNQPDLLVAATGARTISLYLNNGDETFRLAKDYEFETFGLTWPFVVTDINNDGLKEMIRGGRSVYVLPFEGRE
jgi:hypothetical protein